MSRAGVAASCVMWTVSANLVRQLQRRQDYFSLFRIVRTLLYVSAALPTLKIGQGNPINQIESNQIHIHVATELHVLITVAAASSLPLFHIRVPALDLSPGLSSRCFPLLRTEAGLLQSATNETLLSLTECKHGDSMRPGTMPGCLCL